MQQTLQVHLNTNKTNENQPPIAIQYPATDYLGPFQENASIFQSQYHRSSDHPGSKPANRPPRPNHRPHPHDPGLSHHEPGRTQQAIGSYSTQAKQQAKPKIAPLPLSLHNDLRHEQAMRESQQHRAQGKAKGEKIIPLLRSYQTPLKT